MLLARGNQVALAGRSGRGRLSNRSTLPPQAGVLEAEERPGGAESGSEDGKSEVLEEPRIDAQTGLALYRDLMLGREFETTTAMMYQRGKTFGFVHLYNGQEAVSTGCIAHLRQDDYVASTYRDHMHALSKGCDPRNVMAELFGRSNGICRGQGGSMHMFSREHNLLGGYAFVGEGIPCATGAAFQTAYRRRSMRDDSANQVTVCIFGDGATNNGAFFECLNMASLYRLPIIFVVENNLWAIGMYHHRASSPSLGDSSPQIWKKGPAFGMPGKLVDGMDVLAVREAALEATERARNDEGPTLLELETYRYRGHSIADPDELREREEKEFFKEKDPIPRLRSHLLNAGLATQEQLESIHSDILARMDDACDFAENSPFPEKSQLLENVFPDPKGFGIAEDGNYHYQQPGFMSGVDF